MASGATNILTKIPTITSLAAITGSATTPSISFINDLDTGIYNPVANSLNFTIGGVLRYGFDSSRFYGRTSDTNGLRISSSDQVTLADDATLDLSLGTAGSLLISAYDPGSGIGSVWFCVYNSTAFRLAASAFTANTDSDGSLCVFKSANSHTITLKNRLGSSKNIRIAIFGGQT